MLHPQDLTHAPIPEDATPFSMDHAYQRAQAAILERMRGRTSALAPGVVLAPRHGEAIARVGHRIGVVERRDHLIPVGWREAK